MIYNIYYKRNIENSFFLDILSLKINYCININNYIQDANPKFLEFYTKSSKNFFTLMEKKNAKVINVYRNIFKEMSTKNLICSMVYYNLFLKRLQIYFRINSSDFIFKYMNEIIMENIKFSNLQLIRKIGVLLSGDNWKRVALQDNHE